ncbi:MAG TPA: MFS transporter, partial [Leptospiraceae bacterium]|nr:MFS transporter [Leptospiraceae bacterium]
MLLRSELILLSALFLIQFTHILDFVIIMPLGKEFMSAFGVDNRGFGIIVSSYTISAGFFSLVSAFFQDRFDRKKTLIFCYIG